MLGDILFLMKRGFTWEMAETMDPALRIACVVLHGLQEGGKWNWHTAEWER